MATVNPPARNPLDTLHEAFSQEQINEMRAEDISTGYRVASVLIAVVSFGTLTGLLGVWLATR